MNKSCAVCTNHVLHTRHVLHTHMRLGEAEVDGGKVRSVNGKVPGRE